MVREVLLKEKQVTRYKLILLFEFIYRNEKKKDKVLSVLISLCLYYLN